MSKPSEDVEYKQLGYVKYTRKDGSVGLSPRRANPMQYRRLKVTNTRTKARLRAKEHGLPYDVSIDYLMSIFPEDSVCPVFGTPMVWGEADGKNNSPSLDRIIPELGYVEGNVVWISTRANRLKQDASLDDMKRLYTFYSNLQTTRH